MSGYCPDCGNTLCICDEVTRATYPCRQKIKDLEQKLAIAIEALEMISLDNIYVGVNGWRYEYLLGYNQAKEALAKIDQK